MDNDEERSKLSLISKARNFDHTNKKNNDDDYDQEMESDEEQYKADLIQYST